MEVQTCIPARVQPLMSFVDFVLKSPQPHVAAAYRHHFSARVMEMLMSGVAKVTESARACSYYSS